MIFIDDAVALTKAGYCIRLLTPETTTLFRIFLGIVIIIGPELLKSIENGVFRGSGIDILVNGSDVYVYTLEMAPTT
jgi:hypothetical protein